MLIEEEGDDLEMNYVGRFQITQNGDLLYESFSEKCPLYSKRGDVKEGFGYNGHLVEEDFKGLDEVKQRTIESLEDLMRDLGML